ncbi:MAG: hypothetical protein PHU23_00130 [Dehalococcoidales bacterium]|nr:hypothetical protein [Dehalococcoidales bacterium]
MGNRQYLQLSEDLTATDRANYRADALASGILACFENNIGVWDPKEIPASGPKPTKTDVINFLMRNKFEPPASIDVREFQPILDAGTALDQWNTAALAAVGTEYSIFQAIAAPAGALRNKKLVVWYKVQIETIPCPVSRLVFRRNAAGGIPMAQFDLEQLVTGQKVDAYFSTPQIWLPTLTYAINVMCRIATGAVSRVIPGNFVFEPAGTSNQ